MSYLLKQAGYRAQDNSRLVMGGPMMGFTVPDPEVPVVKTTNCLLAPVESELPSPPPPQACIRCGMCAEACPASLLPQQLFWFAQGKEFEKLEQHQLFDCIECGACSWACPSNIPLVQYYRASKAEILRQRQEHEKAEQSRQRFEARQLRIEREKAEKEARRAARKKAAQQRAQAAAADGSDAEDPIQAAINRARAKKAAQQSSGGETSELQKLENTVETTRKRLEKASEKLAHAQSEGSDLVAALHTGVEKTRAKLASAEDALRQYRQSHSAKTAADPDAQDPAAAAIARARAARAADSALGPAEKARQQLLNLEKRLEKTRARLEASRSAGEEQKVVDALESTVARLEEKVTAARERAVGSGATQ
jgi:electron transport complex protein RnfC